MAKNTQEARVDVTLNGEAAKNEMKSMKEQLEEFTKELLRLQKTPVSALKPGEVQKMGELRKETQKLEKQIKSAEEKTEAFARTLKNINGASLKDLQAAARRLSFEVKELAPGTQEFIEKSKQLKDVNTRIVQLRTTFKGVVEEQKRVTLSMGGLTKAFAGIAIGFATVKRVVSGIMDAYKTISNFEQANANLASILGATSDQMEVLEKAAIQLGSSTRYSASQVTGLQTELAKLGFTVKEITDMSPAVLNFAGSVGTDLASAASLAGVALRSFNLRSDQTEDALGTMAVACNKSALSFEYLQNSFSTIAPVAKTYGLSLKDTIALLGTLANAGFDASSAATATRNILLNLSDTNGKLAKALGGSVHSFEDIMDAMKKLRDQGVDLNQTLELTDKRSVAAFNTFLDGAESAQTLRGELEDVNGELQRMAEQRANTVEGAIDGMKSAWEGLVLSFRNSTGIFSKVFKTITQGINGLRDMIDPEGTIETRAAQRYTEMFRNIGNEFISIEETRVRVWQKYQELEQSIRDGGGSVVYKKHALEGLKQAYNAVMPELTEMATEANAKVLEINTEYSKKENELYQKRATLLEKNSKAAQTKEWANIEKQIEANRKAWNQAIEDATRFKEKMDEIVSGDDPQGGSGGGGGGGLTDKELKKQQQAYNKEKAILDAALNYEEKQLKVSLLKKEITEEDYQAKIKEMKAQYYENLLALADKYHQDDTSIQAAMLDDQIKELEAAAKKAADIAKKEAEAFEKTRQKAIASLKKELQELEQLEKDAQDVMDKLHPKMKIDREFNDELKNLEKMHAAKLLSEEDYLAAVEDLHKEHNKALFEANLEDAMAYVEKANAIIDYASKFVAQIKEAETAQLEAEYQKQLTAAGDNAEQREAIEADYEQKKLDLQKKYADVEMGINIAKAIGAAALAVMQAWAAAGGQPILFAIYAALIAATTAVEIATLVKQRNAIKSMSVGSGSSSAPKTGQRTVTGYAEGGYTENHTTLTTVGERGTEWVAPAWMVRQNPVTFSNLENYRKAGSHGRSGSISKGFAEGGYTGQPTVAKNATVDVISKADLEEAVETAISRSMANGAIRAYLVRKDLTELDAQDARFKKQTSRS